MKKNKKRAFDDDSQASADDYQLPDIGRLKKELPRQWLLYQKGGVDDWMEAFSNGVCFNSQIQHQMIVDQDVRGMIVFAKYWDLVPNERLFMVHNGTLEMNAAYLRQRSLGKQCIELVKSSRFSLDFLRENASFLTKEALEYCVLVRKINLKKI